MMKELPKIVFQTEWAIPPGKINAFCFPTA